MNAGRRCALHRVGVHVRRHGVPARVSDVPERRIKQRLHRRVVDPCAISREELARKRLRVASVRHTSRQRGEGVRARVKGRERVQIAEEDKASRRRASDVLDRPRLHHAPRHRVRGQVRHAKEGAQQIGAQHAMREGVPGLSQPNAHRVLREQTECVRALSQVRRVRVSPLPCHALKPYGLDAIELVEADNVVSALAKQLPDAR
eukprot:137892-Pleurochrysis_carterae.AAC.1